MDLDRMTRKQMIIHEALHLRAVDYLFHGKREEEVCCLSDVVVQVEMSALATYVECHEHLIMTNVKLHGRLQPRLLRWISISLNGTLKHCMASGQGYYLREVFNLLLGLERHILTLLQRC